jgi:hypothetical protein
MECEMCSYLKWELTVDGVILANFETMVKRDFHSPGPYLTYSLQTVSKMVQTVASLAAAWHLPPSGTSMSPIPSFG